MANNNGLKELLNQLCFKAQRGLFLKEKMPYQLQMHDNAPDPWNPRGRKCRLKLSEYLPNYFKDSGYSIEVLNKLKVGMQKEPENGVKVRIEIQFYEPCWRLEYHYRIEYEQNISTIYYSCAFDPSEEVPDFQKGLENLVFATQFIEKRVIRKFLSMLTDNDAIQLENEKWSKMYEVYEGRLRRLCSKAEEALRDMGTMPISFQMRYDRIDASMSKKRRCGLVLIEHLPQYFKDSGYSISVLDKLAIRLIRSKESDVETIITINFDESLWRLIYQYHIERGQALGALTLFFAFEKKPNIEGAFENLVFATQYVEKHVEKAFVNMLKAT